LDLLSCKLIQGTGLARIEEVKYVVDIVFKKLKNIGALIED
jgi:hypothetical protein